MPLPKIDTPVYDVKQPSSKKTFKFRPFTVKEQKILLIANEEKSERAFLNAAEQIISNCSFGKLNAENLTPADLEYLILKIRAKSVGETSEIIFTCPECGEKIPVKINLDEIKFTDLKDLPDTIELANKVGVTLKRLTVKDIMEIQNQKENTEIDIVCRSIVSIFDAESIHDASSVSKKELVEFVESLTTNHLEKIQAYITNTQEVYYDLSLKCPKCGKEIKTRLKGLSDFF